MIKFKRKTLLGDWEYIPNLFEFIKEHNFTSIHVGTDSQSKEGKFQYATCIVLRNYKRGATILVSDKTVETVLNFKNKTPLKDGSNWNRLFKESEMSVQVANELRENGIIVDSIDLDYNEDKKQWSNSVLMAGVGMVKGCGFTATTKPNVGIAAFAANKFCRK